MTENYSHLEDLTANMFFNSNYIRRYSNTRLIQEETDSQHTMTMQLMALFFYNKYPKLRIEKIIYKILVHDLDESLAGTKHGQQIFPFGDVPRGLKYYNEDSYELVRSATEDTLDENVQNKQLVHDIKKAKYDFSTKLNASESAFVNILDSLQVLIKIRDEAYLQGGNPIIMAHYKDALEGYKDKLKNKFVEPHMKSSYWKDIYEECFQYYEDFKEEYYKLKK